MGRRRYVWSTTFDDPAWLSHDDVQKLATTELEETFASAETRSGMRQSRIENIRGIEVERAEKGRYFNLLDPLSRHAISNLQVLNIIIHKVNYVTWLLEISWPTELFIKKYNLKTSSSSLQTSSVSVPPTQSFQSHLQLLYKLTFPLEIKFPIYRTRTNIC